MIRLLCLAVCLGGAVAVTSDAHANAPAPMLDATRGPDAARLSRASRSVGYPDRGRLRHAVRLRPSRFVQYADEVAKSGHAWGTWELVQLVERAAYRVAARTGRRARLLVGELSKLRGGRIAGHNSHQNGRDVDLAFYTKRSDGTPAWRRQFVRFSRGDLAFGRDKGLRFDTRRNWELVQKLVADGDARVQYIFVANNIARRLIKYARLAKANPVVLERARRVMTQPSAGHRHDNHFHVRIYCAPADRPRCADRAPIHPWYPGSWR